MGTVQFWDLACQKETGMCQQDTEGRGLHAGSGGCKRTLLLPGSAFFLTSAPRTSCWQVAFPGENLFLPAQLGSWSLQQECIAAFQWATCLLFLRAVVREEWESRPRGAEAVPAQAVESGGDGCSSVGRRGIWHPCPGGLSRAQRGS